jgi:hypothetical protein
MKRSNRSLTIAAMVVSLLLLAATWPGGTGLRAQSPALSVTPLGDTLTASDLVEDLVGEGVTFSNVVFTGDSRAAGRFSGGAAIMGIGNGVILSSGRVVDVIGPNVGKGEFPGFADATTTQLGQPGNADLAALIPGNIASHDATILEFDFVPTFDLITAKYVFASEEFNEFTNSEFTDVFAFFVNGENQARLGDARTVVAINTVNGGTRFNDGTGECTDGSDNDDDRLIDAADPDCTTQNDNIVGEGDSNSQFYRNNDCSDPDGGTACPVNIESDGFTTVLTFRARVNRNEVNHIRLGITDMGDASLDSWIFIQAGSLISSPAETCHPDGSPNLADEDGDGLKDEGCFVTQQLHFTSTSPRRTANFSGDSKLGSVRDNSLTLDHMFGVLQNFDVTVKGTIEDPADMTFSPDHFGTRTECSLNKLDDFDTTEQPCVRYEVVTNAKADTHYVGGDRAVQLTIAFFQPTEQKLDPVTLDPVTDPVMGFTHDCGTFNQSILDHAIFPPGEDPEGVGYTDAYGSCAIMGVTPRPDQPAQTDACHVDGTPNGIDEDRDGVVDDGCEVTKDFTFAPNQTAHTYVFDDHGNIKPHSIKLDHKLGVTDSFTVRAIATIVHPNDPTLMFGYGLNTRCASNLTKPNSGGSVACVHYEFLGADNTKYTTGTDAVEFTIRYFAPETEASQKVAGMGYSALCDGSFPMNILRTFIRFPGDSDPEDPEGVGYVDEYGSCVIMTGSDPPPLELDLPADIQVVATSAAGAAVSFTATATGVIDGVVTTFDATCAPPSGSTFPIGQTTVTCTASDSVETSPGVNRTTTGTFNVNVVYGICVLYDTVKPKKAGSTIPIVLNLCDAGGNNLSSEAIVVHATSLTHLSGTADGEPEDPGSSQPDNDFRFTSPSYHFNLQTSGLASGSWTLNFTVGGDPTVYSTPFAIK